MKIIKNILMYMWQLPQNLIGLLILLWTKGEVKHKFKNIVYYYYDPFPGGISLGNYLILGSQHIQTIKHEYGHAIQSKLLGPLYLLIIGIPSLIWAGLYGTVIKKTKNGYYKFYTEKWADHLVNIKRK